jgi:hypothetical protein
VSDRARRWAPGLPSRRYRYMTARCPQGCDWWSIPHLCEVRLDLAGGEALGRERDRHLIHPAQRRWRLRTSLGSKVASRSPPDVELHRRDVSDHRLGAGAVA